MKRSFLDLAWPKIFFSSAYDIIKEKFLFDRFSKSIWFHGFHKFSLLLESFNKGVLFGDYEDRNAALTIRNGFVWILSRSGVGLVRGRGGGVVQKMDHHMINGRCGLEYRTMSHWVISHQKPGVYLILYIYITYPYMEVIFQHTKSIAIQ